MNQADGSPGLDVHWISGECGRNAVLLTIESRRSMDFW